MLKKVFRSQLGPLFALVFIVALFAVADRIWGAGFFLSARNLRVMMSSASLIAVPAFGMTMIIIAGGIDLSAGTALTLCGTVLALQLKHSEVAAADPGFAWTMIGALVVMSITGCLCGFANGLLISATKVVPFIVTLGTMTIFLGVGQILAGETTVYAPMESFPNWLKYLCYTGSNDANYLIEGVRVPTSVMIAGFLALVWGL